MSHLSRTARLGLLLLGVVPLAVAVLPGQATAAAPAGDVRIEVLSGRGDVVSGGDAYVRVIVPANGNRNAVRVDDDGRDVTPAFRVRPGGVDGIVKGLSLGRNVIRAILPDGRGARITLTNHPIGGPVFSGPQIQPWTCSAGAKDKQCNRPQTYDYLYKSTSGGSLKAYNTDSPPTDVANTTTDQGKTVPFIVRRETGVTVRDQYRIAVLFAPKKSWDPTAAQEGYNHKLVLTHGASCDTSYEMGSAPDVLLEDALSRGFAVASHALDNAGHNCNIVTEAESLIVTKELVAERYGPIRYTIGSGCSGGSLVQQKVANAYPGVYQGILPQCSFTDAWSSAQQYEDYVLLRAYFEDPSKQDPTVGALSPLLITNAYGHPNPVNPITFTEVIPNSGKPDRSCPGLDPAVQYNAQTRPKGVRCTLQDYMVNVFGRRPDGKAWSAWDNTGIQYALTGLLDGTVTAAQFADLNAKVGGWNTDLLPQATRTDAGPIAMDRAYRSGAVNTGANLDQVAIIDLRGPDPGAFHDVYRTYSMRERLKREHGTAENQVLWRGQVALLGDTNFVTQGIQAIDKWLAVVEKDTRSVSLARKVLDARKAAAVVDRCTNGAGVDLPAAICDGTVQAYASPRISAGAPVADDTLKCQLVPLKRTAYTNVTFTDAQWATLQKTFPTGVCDYSKPSVGYQETKTWQAYDVVGGRPLGAAPVSVPFRGADTSAGGLGAAPGSLPTTGLPVGLAGVGLLLVAAATGIRRVRRRGHA
ncbi:MAG: hypothetical protein JJD92_13680 [Frankiaceae bacterium]|nr:hypothetical protein [Frankiaceae bacterium]